MDDIEKQLSESPTHQIIVSASAASNVTSKITDLAALNGVISSIILMQGR